MKKAFRTRSIALILGLTLVLLSVSVAFAAPPQPVVIVVHEDIDSGPDPFIASAPLCTTGTVTDSYPFQYGPSQGNYTVLYVDKYFVCDDGSGTFDISMKVKLDANGYTTANWEFTGGTGAYANIWGKGKLEGTPTLPGYILDVYDGKVH